MLPFLQERSYPGSIHMMKNNEREVNNKEIFFSGYFVQLPSHVKLI